MQLYDDYQSMSPPATDLFSTNFPVIENPLSQGGGKWVLGANDGGSWNNPKVTANACVGSVDMSGGSLYADDIGHLKPSFIPFANNQYAEGVVYIAPGYTGNTGYHEIEILLRFSITAGVARGYEIITGIGPGPTDCYHAIVRWNGGVGSYDALWDTQVSGGGPSYPVDGLRIRGEIVGQNIMLYRNGVLFKTLDTLAFDGTGFTSGQPGLGFWPSTFDTVTFAIPNNMGWKSYKAGNL